MAIRRKLGRQNNGLVKSAESKLRYENKELKERIEELEKQLSIHVVVKSSYCYAVNEHEGKCQQQCLGCSMKQRRLEQ